MSLTDRLDQQAVSTASHAGSPAAEPSRRYSWTVFSVTSLGVLLTGLNASTLDVALPTVVRHFDASATAASWILLSYLLVSTILILPFGRLADIIGRRRLYLAGLAVLTLSSLIAGAAPNVGVLIAARIGQAVGAASIQANVTAILTDAFPTRKLSLALGLNVTVAGVGLVAGPALGGVLVDSVGWRSVFWFNVPFGVLGLVWAALALRELPRKGERETLRSDRCFRLAARGRLVHRSHLAGRYEGLDGLAGAAGRGRVPDRPSPSGDQSAPARNSR